MHSAGTRCAHQDAVSLGAGDLILDQEHLRSAVQSAPESSSTVVSRMKSVWNTAAEICSKADNIHKGYLLLMQLFERVQRLLQHAAASSAQQLLQDQSRLSIPSLLPVFVPRTRSL
jgi:hypothetical protein